jgi:hypothetical protein
MDGQHIRIDLELLDSAKFPLANRGFHWIQEYPFNH